MKETKIDEREGNTHPHNISVVVLYCSHNSGIHYARHNYLSKKKRELKCYPNSPVSLQYVRK